MTAPAFTSLAEAREFYAKHPELNPAEILGNAAGNPRTQTRIMSTPKRGGDIPAAPHRITDVFLQEQFDEEGDTIWALWGRGLMVTTYSIREVDHLIETVMTPAEREQLAARPNASPRALITRLRSHGDDPLPETVRRGGLEVVVPKPGEGTPVPAIGPKPNITEALTPAKAGPKRLMSDEAIAAALARVDAGEHIHVVAKDLWQQHGFSSLKACDNSLRRWRTVRDRFKKEEAAA